MVEREERRRCLSGNNLKIIVFGIRKQIEIAVLIIYTLIGNDCGQFIEAIFETDFSF